MKTFITLILAIFMISSQGVVAQKGGNGNGVGASQFVTICKNGNTMQVNINSLQNHINQGAILGACPCVDPNQINVSVLCTAQYEPVCGCNGVTYSNACVATYYGGVTSYTNGPCESCLGEPLNVFCPTYYEPVCGCDGVTYSNGCFAAAAGVQSTTPGACGSGVAPSRMSLSATESVFLIGTNPIRDHSTIRFSLGTDQGVAVKMYNSEGKWVKTLYDGAASAGFTYSFDLDATQLPAGMYLLKLMTEKEVKTERVVVAH